MKYLNTILWSIPAILLTALLMTGCRGEQSESQQPQPQQAQPETRQRPQHFSDTTQYTTTGDTTYSSSGLKFVDLKVGNGGQPAVRSASDDGIHSLA